MDWISVFPFGKSKNEDDNGGWQGVLQLNYSAGPLHKPLSKLVPCHVVVTCPLVANEGMWRITVNVSKAMDLGDQQRAVLPSWTK